MPPNWARVRVSPASRRSLQDCTVGVASVAVSDDGGDFLRKPNMEWRVFRGKVVRPDGKIGRSEMCYQNFNRSDLPPCATPA